MKKKKLLAAFICGLCLAAGASAPAYADGMKVVTLGADLTDAQKQTMMKYFKANPNEVQILTVTNKDEREHLGGYVPLEQIGTRTVSCAYVRPTNSGGIKVRTANLNYVTGNMIAATLSTSGVKNCEVIAACPFEVSGTGALTGIQMAYETASGEKLDPKKKEIATEEIVVTGQLASEVGNSYAIDVVNKAKMEVIQNDVQNAEEIYNIVTNVVTQNNVNINQDQLNQIVSLLEKIAKEDYSYEDMEATLTHIDENVSGVPGAMDEAVDAMDDDEFDDTFDDGSEDEEEPDFDSILNDIDESDLGEDVVTSSTEDQSLEVETYGEEAVYGEEEDDDEELVFDFDDFDDSIFADDGDLTDDDDDEFNFGGDEDDDEFIFGNEDDDDDFVEGDDGDEFDFDDEDDLDGDDSGISENAGLNGDNNDAEASKAEEITKMTDKLSEQAKSQYQKLEKFCKGEYNGDDTALEDAMGSDFMAALTFNDQVLADKLSEAVRYEYLVILTEGTFSYVRPDDAKYMDDELNMMDEYLKKLFGVDGKSLDAGEEDILKDLSQEDRDLLYADTISFFEKLYGESTFEDDLSFESEGDENFDEYDDTDDFYEDDNEETDDTGYEETDEVEWPEETDFNVDEWDYTEEDGDF